jgi:alanine-alpha-ketoisovalerate/valine-pyruvate aminotransferase
VSTFCGGCHAAGDSLRAVMAVPASIALAEAQVAGAMAAALVHAGLLRRLIAQIPCHAVQKAVASALRELTSAMSRSLDI